MPLLTWLSRRRWRAASGWPIPLSLALLSVTDSAIAETQAPDVFCATYPTSPRCAEPLPCAFCHTSTTSDPPTWNAFGAALVAELGGPGVETPVFVAELPSALASIELLDSDGDTFTNVEEIENGSLPGDPTSVPFSETCPESTQDLPYALCAFDPEFAFRRVNLHFCGQSPSYDEMQAFRASSHDEKIAALSTKLDHCVDTEHWLGKDGVLWSMAHKRVRPVGALKAGEDEGQFPASDYYVDYHLWVYAQIDGHDARDVVLGDYFVERTTNPTQYTKVDDYPGQPMLLDRRQGMLTTQWVMLYNVMFTAIPRAAAARAYTNFLGYDIAKDQGLFAVPGEPVDYDGKGVGAEGCRDCHSTLDPLTYPFRNYNGLAGGIPRYQYVPGRLEFLSQPGQMFADEPATLATTPENGYLLGQPVADLAEWASVAADSDAFSRALVIDYFQTLVGRAPDLTNAAEAAEVDALVQTLVSSGHSVEAMLQALILTEAYGGP